MKYFYAMEKGKFMESMVVPNNWGNPELALELVNAKFKKNYIRGDFYITTFLASNEEYNESIQMPLGTTKEEALEVINNNSKEHYSTIQELKENEHICKYCGSIVKGKDEDILCEECRDCFGHTFYSEL